jgi:hypothetical protein
MGWGGLSKARETERHVPKESTAISTRVFLELVCLPVQGKIACGKHVA